MKYLSILLTFFTTISFDLLKAESSNYTNNQDVASVKEKTIIVTHQEKQIQISDLAKGIAGLALVLGGITMFSPEAAAALWKFLILITEQPRYQPTVILHHTHPNWFSWYFCNLCR